MAVRNRPAAAEPRLDPVRWRAPRRSTLARAVLTAALLLAAAGAIYAPDTSTDPVRRASASPAGGATAPPAGVAGPPGGAASLPGGATSPPGGAASPGGAGEGGTPGQGQVSARLPVPTGSLGVPVRVAEPATLAVLRPGDRIDLLAVPAGGGRARSVGADVLVLGVTRDADGVPGSAVLYVALNRHQAERAVGTPEHTRFAALVRP